MKKIYVNEKTFSKFFFVFSPIMFLADIFGSILTGSIIGSVIGTMLVSVLIFALSEFLSAPKDKNRALDFAFFVSSSALLTSLPLYFAVFQYLLPLMHLL